MRHAAIEDVLTCLPIITPLLFIKNNRGVTKEQKIKCQGNVTILTFTTAYIASIFQSYTKAKLGGHMVHHHAYFLPCTEQQCWELTWIMGTCGHVFVYVEETLVIKLHVSGSLIDLEAETEPRFISGGNKQGCFPVNKQVSGLREKLGVNVNHVGDTLPPACLC